MLLGAEVRHRVGGEEDVDPLHEGDEGGRQAPDVCVDAGDDELVACGVLHALLQVGAIEGAVAPLGEHDVVGARGELRDDPGGAGVAQSRTPEVGEQRTLGRVLGGRLGRVDDGHARLAGRSDEGPHPFDRGVELRRSVRAGRVERPDEVLLHVVHEKDGAMRLQAPRGHVVGQAGLGVEAVGADRRNRHESGLPRSEGCGREPLARETLAKVSLT